SPLDIMIEAPIGAASFNNEFGRPAVCGYFRTFEQRAAGDPPQRTRGYHKPIMIAGGLGNVRRAHVEKAEVEVGAKLVVLGGPACRRWSAGATRRRSATCSRSPRPRSRASPRSPSASAARSR